MKIKTPKISLASGVSFLISVLLVYEGWYLEKFEVIPYFLQAITILIVLLTALLALKKGIRIRKYIPFFWVLFVASCLVGVIFSSAASHALDSLITLISFLVVIVCAGIVFDRRSDSNYLENSMICIAILSAVAVLINPFDYSNGLYTVTTMGEHNNPNSLSFTMTLGAYFILIPRNQEKKIPWIFRFAIALVFLKIVLDTGSRSGLICMGTILFLSLGNQFVFATGNRTNKSLKRLMLILLALGLIAAGVILFTNGQSSSGGLVRLIEQFDSRGFTGRTHLYESAWNYFKQKPILGIGFDCFEILSGYEYYTHSTYMELLACTGGIGFILFLYPVAEAFIRSIKNFKADRGRNFAILTFFIVNGFFTIWFYNLVNLAILYLTILRGRKNEQTS